MRRTAEEKKKLKTKKYRKNGRKTKRVYPTGTMVYKTVKVYTRNDNIYIVEKVRLPRGERASEKNFGNTKNFVDEFFLSPVTFFFFHAYTHT